MTELNKKGKDYIIEGCPQTRVQANALQKMGIVPDKFFILKITDAMISQKIKDEVHGYNEEKPISEAEIEEIAKNTITEYNMYHKK